MRRRSRLYLAEKWPDLQLFKKGNSDGRHVRICNAKGGNFAGFFLVFLFLVVVLYNTFYSRHIVHQVKDPVKDFQTEPFIKVDFNYLWLVASKN